MDAPIAWVISPDPDTRRLIGLNLSKRGLDVTTAASQGEVPFSDAKPHVIILDVVLPDEVGWETAGALRESPQLQGVPLILVLAAAPSARWLIPLQPVHWVEKPLAVGALLALVRQGLAGHGPEHTSVDEMTAGAAT